MKKEYQSPETASIALDKEVQPLALTMGTGGHTGGGGHAKRSTFYDDWEEIGGNFENKKQLYGNSWND